MITQQITIHELVTAVAFGDLGFLAKQLKKITLTRDMFLQLCRAAIDVGSMVTLKWLLDAYYQHWTQPVFNEIIRYIRLREQYHFYSFIDGYIDTVNAKFEAMQTSTVKKTPEKKALKKKLSFIDKLKKLWRKS
jgi:hypothetical protein